MWNFAPQCNRNVSIRLGEVIVQDEVYCIHVFGSLREFPDRSRPACYSLDALLGCHLEKSDLIARVRSFASDLLMRVKKMIYLLKLCQSVIVFRHSI